MQTIEIPLQQAGHYYSLFVLLAVLTGMLITGIVAQKQRFPLRQLAVILASGILLMLIGSRMIMFSGGQWIHFLTNGHLPESYGKSVLGIIAGCMAGVFLAARYMGKSAAVLDLFAIALPFAMAVQRVGCLLAGCCFGAPSNVPWAIVYGRGTEPYRVQQAQGLIPEDALSTLPVHPGQVYQIVACLLIGVMAILTRRRWKAPASHFLFSVTLYIGFRFFEEFTAYSSVDGSLYHFGLRNIQWGLLVGLAALAMWMVVREGSSKFKVQSLKFKGHHSLTIKDSLKAFVFVLLLAWLAFSLRKWLSREELFITGLFFAPLCLWVAADFFHRLVFPRLKWAGYVLPLVMMMMMSQKADDGEIPKSYTAFHLIGASGFFDEMHDYNAVPMGGNNCNGGTTYDTKWVTLRHQYKAGGMNISYSKWYNETRKITVGSGFYYGTEDERSHDGLFENNHRPMWAVNPLLQYDGYMFGLGAGIAMGKLAYDIPPVYPNTSYSPFVGSRVLGGQYRLRLFPEKLFFIEGTYGYEIATMGERNALFMIGSRFNTSDRYLLKIGIVKNNRLAMQGQFPLSDYFFIFPSLIISTQDKSLTQGILGLQYRLFSR